MSTNCLFCKICSGDIPSDKVYADDIVFVFRDIKPVAPVHVLVVPRHHIASLAAVKAGDEWIVHVMTTIGKLARDLGIEQSGYRVVTNHGDDAGQTVDHLHFHLLGGRPLGWPPG